MKTYAETRGAAPFNWTQWLTQQEELIKSGQPLSDPEWEGAKTRAKSWVTCACGNQCAVIPRNSEGKPYDTVLTEIGGDSGFFSAIQDHNPTAALHFLSLIEQHSVYLIDLEVAAADARRREVLELAGRSI